MKIAFVGGGNMAAALIGGLLRQGHATADIDVIEIDSRRCDELRRDFGVRAATSPDASLRSADVVLLAVKPQQMRIACEAVRPHLASPLVVSIAAGIGSRDIARWLGCAAIVRTMPNTPALIGAGVTGLWATAQVDAAARAQAESILATAGRVIWFDDEVQLDAVTAVSGSGPAYVFYFIEALARAASELGLTQEQARLLAVQTFAGASGLAVDSNEAVSTLRERVTSKGGTTAAALAKLEAAGVAASIVQAVHAAHRRAVELGEQSGRQ